MKYRFSKNKKALAHKSMTEGFTLIEILVVLAIISLLSSIVFSSLQSARSKARDAQRMITMEQLQIGVELHALNNGGNYFYPFPNYTCGSSTCWRTWSCEENGTNWTTYFRTEMAPYIELTPDPLTICGGNYRKYVYMSNGRDYKLQFINPENPNSLKAKADPYLDGGPQGSMLPGSCVGVNDGTNITAWSVYTPGAQCWTH